MSDPLLVLSTVGSAADAEKIAGALVERQLAACVNIVPGVVSVYRWKGALQRDAEWLLLMKTTATKLEALRLAVLELHPYELPELVVWRIEGGHVPYLEWLDAALRDSAG